MKKLTIIVLVLVVLPMTIFAQQKKNNPQYVIDSIKAYLYFELKGEFKEITNNIALWNTIIGEGDAGSPSNSTMIIIKILKKYGEGMGSGKIRLIATGGELLLKDSTYFELYDDNYTYYAPFWLNGTGCDIIKLTAEIINEQTIGNKKRQFIEYRAEKTIEFQCGE